MAVSLVTRTLLDLDPILFPNGLEPGSLVHLHGASGSGQTGLLTHLLARLVTGHPTRKVILIDTRGIFNAENFCRVVSSMVPEIQTDLTTTSYSDPAVLRQFLPYLDRVFLIRCHTPEDLLFCFGPKNAGMLEKMLLTCSDFSLVMVDSLDAFSYCASLPNIKPLQQCPDFFMMLKRCVGPTKTPVIFVCDDYKKGFAEENDQDPSLQFLAPESDAQANLVSDTSQATHSLLIQKHEKSATAQQSKAKGEKEEEKRCETESLEFTAHLRSRNNPNMALSGANHRVKFSILSGILKWLPE